VAACCAAVVVAGDTAGVAVPVGPVAPAGFLASAATGAADATWVAGAAPGVLDTVGVPEAPWVLGLFGVLAAAAEAATGVAGVRSGSRT
jgi:hypothetical protein